LKNLLPLLLSTFAAGVGSVWIAAMLLRMGWLPGNDERDRSHGTQHLLSLAAGALLATAFMNLLPEALESKVDAKNLFSTLLIGVVFFFLLDKAELWHHGHEHHHEHDEGHAHHGHGHHGHGPRAGGWAILTGDSFHCFGDGVLIASAFVADVRLGLVAALAVLAHEVPHHIGDLVVLRSTTGGDRNAALLKVSLAGAVTPLGGLVGWWLVDRLHDFLPYFLAVASSSFIYVALADLIPQLQKRLGARETVAQIAWLFAGIGMVTVVSALAHH
jgi:zinc and cadmium transporter